MIRFLIPHCGEDNRDFHPVVGCSVVHLCFHLPCSLFSQFSQHLGIHTCSKHDSDEKTIQLVRAKLIFLYRLASSSFPTCCTEHRGRGSWCTTQSSWEWLNSSFCSTFGLFGHSWASKLSPAMCNKRFQSLWVFKNQPEVQQAPDLLPQTPSPWSRTREIDINSANWTYLSGKIQWIAWEQLNNFNCKRHHNPWGEHQWGEGSPLVTDGSENRRVPAGGVRHFQLQC